MKKNWHNHLFNFLAVILGVYLAFYINERAKANQNHKESLIVMKSLINDITEDIKSYEEYQIPVNSQHLQNIEGLLAVLSTDSIQVIESKLASVLQLQNYSAKASTYNAMKYSGNLWLIEDLSLQKEISSFYESVVDESEQKGVHQADFFEDELLKWFMNNVDLTEMKIFKTDELIVLQNKLIIYGSLLEQKIQSYELIVEDAKKLKTQIETILASN